ncbi:putative phosphoesterase [Cyclobacterium lianum]|uniref:Putative phosphoesterase n=1 Tax=Cyclobacterium lianum TaxID=388280 RepID=A0A1M7MLC1_9BACT|nr:ligase-associated DNA damage response endonuclease PdeM [Cyclobacterium lianum]SHM91712.1 putative phosphoesterase [Cyclobacterium lianum]
MNLTTAGKYIWQYERRRVHLLKEKAIWLEEEAAILIADTHFGKAGHFRKSGIPIPESVHESDYLKLRELITTLQAKKVFFLGDLFHSDHNGAWTVLLDFLDMHAHVDFHLIMGNHDVLPAAMYSTSRLSIHREFFSIGCFVLSHEPLQEVADGKINICGHLHPGIVIKGKGKQSLRLACYFLADNRLILPAFGSFTGLAKMTAKSATALWAIGPEAVIPFKLKNKVC